MSEQEEITPASHFASQFSYATLKGVADPGCFSLKKVSFSFNLGDTKKWAMKYHVQMIIVGCPKTKDILPAHLSRRMEEMSLS